MKNCKNIILGIILILIGVWFGLYTTGVVKVNLLFDGWWTLFIIIPSFFGLFNEEGKTGPLIGLAVGVLLLLSCQDIINFDIVLKLIVPCVLVATGLSIIFKGKIKNKNIENVKAVGGTNYSATFSGQNLDFSKEEFTGTKLDAVFGGIKCDLRNAIINDDVVIEASAIFGGITILVPKEVNVKITSTSIFGGVEGKSKMDKPGKTIYINATCLFGGVEVK
ncbi:MAG: LiaF-related protein [bacterium]|nr:LiaF-related protein [bacterium]